MADHLVTWIAALTDRVSDVAIKHWLKTKGLAHSASNSVELVDRVKNHLLKESLAREDLERAVIGIEECGGKKIYLRSVPDAAMKGLSRKSLSQKLSNLGIRIVDTPCLSSLLPKSPAVDYAVIDDSCLRIKYSETHFNVENDKIIMESKKVPITRVAVHDVDISTGMCQIRLDAAGTFHQHTNSAGRCNDALYTEHYMQALCSIIGVDKLDDFDVSPSIEFLVKQEPRVFRVPHEVVRTSANSFQKFSCRTDVRDDPSRAGANAADREK